MKKKVRELTKTVTINHADVDKLVEYTFDSLEDVKSFIKTPKVHDCDSSHKGSKNFTGTKNFTEAMELLESGWEEGAQMIEKGLRSKLAASSSSIVPRQRSVYDVVGGNCSVPRYLQGVPTSMIRQVKTPVKQPVTDVYVDICYSFSVSQQTIINNCIKVLQEVSNLENSGTRVNLYACKIAYQDGLACLTKICLKRSTERLSIAKLAFPAAHPSMLRRITFAIDEHNPDLPEDFFPTYGYPIKGEIARKAFLEAINN